MPQNEHYDVFISYSSRDRSFVEPIVNVLEDRALNVFFDRDLVVGRPWMGGLQDALLASRVTVIFITPDSLKSGGVTAETEVALIKAMKNDKPHDVIPVLLKETTYDQLSPFLQRYEPFRRSQADLSDPEVRHEIGESLADHIKQLVPGIGLPTLDMPFVVCAMNRQEADDLLNKRKPAVNQEKFDSLISGLGKRGYKTEQLLALYGDTRDEWRSPLCRSETGAAMMIRATIEEVVGRINRMVLDEADSHTKEADIPILHPKYFTADFTSKNSNTRNNTYKELGRRGCVLVVDSLSLFHPDLRKYLIDSSLAGPESKIVSIVAPLPYCRPTDTLDSLLEEAMQEVMDRAFFRFNEELNMLCEFGVGHPRALKRWLFSVLPVAAAAIQRQGASPDARRLFRGRVREQA